jgi:hypothetical protein
MAVSISKDAAAQKIADSGYGWMRHEFVERDPFDFTPYDAANSSAKARGIKTLGLLGYQPGGDQPLETWKKFVTTVVSHYGTDIAAWEIMNEWDNYMSAEGYVPYLKEAHSIIKSINPNATVVLGGITSRPQAPSFWNGIQEHGGWGYFDALGLHVYHDGSPEKVNFGGGDLVAELERTVSSISKNGGGKKIWITEVGYQPGEIGEENHANWLARTLIMSRSVSQVEKIFIYRLYDSADSAYGLTTIGLTDRPAVDVLKTLISNVSGLGTGKRLYPQKKDVLETLDKTDGWKTFNHNASSSLSRTDGKTDGALKFSYNFTADSAYTMAEKTLPINGNPEAIAFWVRGDNSRNIFKIRFVDTHGETFQADLGALSSDWSYKQFRLQKDAAVTSWGGNGAIDFPVKFTSFVMDRQGGEGSGEIAIDHLIAVTGGSAYYAYQFGSTVAYWSAEGTGEADLCNARRQFTEAVAYIKNANCDDTPKVNPVITTTVVTQAAPKATPSPKPVVSAAPRPTVDASKSMVRVDGENKLGNGSDAYRIVITVKDTNGAIIKDRKPVIIGDGVTSLTIGETALVGDEWWSTVGSSEAGDKPVTVSADGKELKKLTLKFTAATPSPSPTPSPTAAPVAEKKVAGWRQINARTILIGINIALAVGLLAFAAIKIPAVKHFIIKIKNRNTEEAV